MQELQPKVQGGLMCEGGIIAGLYGNSISYILMVTLELAASSRYIVQFIKGFHESSSLHTKSKPSACNNFFKQGRSQRGAQGAFAPPFSWPRVHELAQGL